ncbi:MAG: DUF4333 domain-containing protein [Gordonia sp. (in: high G+C Gram-positive bacteria)]|uniref:DUF4333 domain-containing protein n=1 Tax=Gordonia sp. (in: high G+C Gram-positive bacteria) TaxID=84139 RepID=UPI003BB6C780
MRTKIAASIGAAALMIVGLAGCSVSKTIDQSELQTKTAQALQPSFNQPITVECKGSLEAKVGATQECALTDGTLWQLVTVTATDDEGKFNAEAVPGVVEKPDWAN